MQIMIARCHMSYNIYEHHMLFNCNPSSSQSVVRVHSLGFRVRYPRSSGLSNSDVEMGDNPSSRSLRLFSSIIFLHNLSYYGIITTMNLHQLHLHCLLRTLRLCFNVNSQLEASHNNKTHVLCLPFMTAPDHRIPKYDCISSLGLE